MTTPTHVHISMDNETKGYGIWRGVEDLSMWYDIPTTLGDIYRHCQSEYGRCISKIYRDVMDESGMFVQYRAVGWSFVKRVKYDGSDETYLQRTNVVPLVMTAPARPAEYNEIGV